MPGDRQGRCVPLLSYVETLVRALRHAALVAEASEKSKFKSEKV